MIGLAGTDLVLPAIPVLPLELPGGVSVAQWVLAAFAAGTGLGLLIFGELGTRYHIGNLLIVSLVGYGVVSVLATFAVSLYELSFWRFIQGLIASAPAVFAPVMINTMYAKHSAIAMLGRLGSIESMAPALAPILGAWLLTLYGWKASFYLTALVAFVLAAIWAVRWQTRQSFEHTQRSSSGYRALLRNGKFMRYSLSQAFTLGALLIIVFAAPTIIVGSMQGDLSDFVTMQVLGISLFVVSANYSHKLVARYGDVPVILAGSILTALGCCGLVVLGLIAPTAIVWLWVLFLFVNLGLGLRGPPGFYLALLAAGDNESRGSALVVLMVMLTTAVGTAVVAPYIESGLLPVSLVASCVSLLSIALLLLPKKIS